MIEFPSVSLRKLTSMLVLGAGLSLFLLSSPASMPAGEEVRVVFDPPFVDFSSTAAATVAVRVEGVADLYGLQLELHFDPTIVTVESIAPGDFLSADFVVQQKIDAAAGRASLAYTQISPKPARSGSGNIAVLALRQTDCLGASSLQLADVLLATSDGHAIAYTTESGTAQSGDSAAVRTLSGLIFHDTNADGVKDPGEESLADWPVYLQRFPADPSGAVRMALSNQDGIYRFDNLTCGRYRIWSRNGETQLASHSVDVSVASDAQGPALPVTESLDYPLQRLFLPNVAKSTATADKRPQWPDP